MKGRTKIKSQYSNLFKNYCWKICFELFLGGWGGGILIMSQYSYVRYWLYNLLNAIFQPLLIAISVFLWEYTVINIFVSCKVYVENKVY